MPLMPITVLWQAWAIDVAVLLGAAIFVLLGAAIFVFATLAIADSFGLITSAVDPPQHDGKQDADGHGPSDSPGKHTHEVAHYSAFLGHVR